MTAGGEAQILLGDHGDIPAKALADQPALGGLLHALWRARPDLRPQLERLAAAKGDKARWLPLLLHDGYFMKGTEAIRMWQETWNHPTWTYLTSDLTPGASFVQQLIPEIVDDVFLHGTVGAVGVTRDHAGRDLRECRAHGLPDRLGHRPGHRREPGTLIGETHSEIRGHVHFVPGVGPVDMLEESTAFRDHRLRRERLPARVGPVAGPGGRDPDPVAERCPGAPDRRQLGRGEVVVPVAGA